MPNPGSGTWGAVGRLTLGPWTPFALPPCPRGPHGSPAEGWGRGQARVCPHGVLGGLGHNLSQPRVPASQNGHRRAPLCGLLEGFVRPGARPRGAGVGWLTSSRFALPLRPLGRRRPDQRQRGRRRGADTDAPAGCRARWRGPPCHAGCPSGFAERLRGARGDGGRVGRPRGAAAAFGHQGAAWGRTPGRLTPARIRETGLSLRSCERSLDIQPPRGEPNPTRGWVWAHRLDHCKRRALAFPNLRFPISETPAPSAGVHLPCLGTGKTSVSFAPRAVGRARRRHRLVALLRVAPQGSPALRLGCPRCPSPAPRRPAAERGRGEGRGAGVERWPGEQSPSTEFAAETGGLPACSGEKGGGVNA